MEGRYPEILRYFGTAGSGDFWVDSSRAVCPGAQECLSDYYRLEGDIGSTETFEVRLRAFPIHNFRDFDEGTYDMLFKLE